jgi:hypothetical protein
VGLDDDLSNDAPMDATALTGQQLRRRRGRSIAIDLVQGMLALVL